MNKDDLGSFGRIVKLMIFQLSLLWLVVFAIQEKLPIVLWHGMGDTCCGESGIGQILIHLESQGYYVHSIATGVTDSEDQRSGYLGNVNEQIDSVCTLLSSISTLKSNGFNAIGFSQGGLFMRGLVQRCDIKIHNLITFGSPHAGVSAIPNCFASSSSACNIAKSLVDSGAYLPFIQSRVVQAQYYRISSRPEIFKEKCILLPDLNQMNQIKDVYKQKFQSLNSFVMVMFLNDSVIIPKESAHFAYFNENMELVQLEGQELWKDDLLGLQRLNVQGKLIRTTLSGSHMNFDMQDIDDYIQKYFEVPMSHLNLNIDKLIQEVNDE